ncbi:MAG: CHAD domain-containing protein [Methylacidiphilales bacterium]|nr:CHAD domain-containing protein [Candidatus Methylacidiphilales bacterium]
MKSPPPALKQISGPLCEQGLLGNHLLLSLKKHGRAYRKKLKRCRDGFSKKSVHELRVETRRLLALLDLLNKMGSQISLPQRTRAPLKKRFDTLSSLRDAQVQSDYVGKMLVRRPELRAFHEFLQRRALRLARSAVSTLKKGKMSELENGIADLKQKLAKQFSDPDAEARCYTGVQQVLIQARDKVLELRRQSVGDASLIHRGRIALKKFRYLLEALQPVLSGIGPRELKAMREEQALVGNIQDAEVLTACINKWVSKKKLKKAPLLSLRKTLVRRRSTLLRAHLKKLAEPPDWNLPDGFEINLKSALPASSSAS